MSFNRDYITIKLPHLAAREALQWIHAHLEDMVTGIDDPDADPKGTERDEYIAMARAFNVMAASYRERFDDLNIRNFWPEDPTSFEDGWL